MVVIVRELHVLSLSASDRGEFQKQTDRNAVWAAIPPICSIVFDIFPFEIEPILHVNHQIVDNDSRFVGFVAVLGEFKPGSFFTVMTEYWTVGLCER